MPVRYAHTVTVIGIWSFPIDMLRYDSLTPDSEDDSNRIINTFNPGAEGISVTLRREAPKDWTPTRRRWNSFLWKVTDHKVRRLP